MWSSYCSLRCVILSLIQNLNILLTSLLLNHRSVRFRLRISIISTFNDWLLISLSLVSHCLYLTSQWSSKRSVNIVKCDKLFGLSNLCLKVLMLTLLTLSQSSLDWKPLIFDSCIWIWYYNFRLFNQLLFFYNRLRQFLRAFVNYYTAIWRLYIFLILKALLIIDLIF